MSFSQTTDSPVPDSPVPDSPVRGRAGAVVAVDAWLATVGVPVERLRLEQAAAAADASKAADAAAAPPLPAVTPEEAAKRSRAYEVALLTIKRADDSVASRFIGRYSPQLQSDYKAMAVPGSGPGDIQDHAQALAALAPKLELAQKVLGALECGITTASAFERLDKFAVYEAQSGRMKGQEDVCDEVSGLRQQAEAKFMKQQFEDGATQLEAAAAKAEPIFLYYETVFAAARNQDLFARAEAVLAGEGAPETLKAVKEKYEQASAELEAARVAVDGKTMAAAHAQKRKTVDEIFLVGMKAQSDAWFAAEMGKPAPAAGTTEPRIADTLATGPGFAELSEEKRFEAVAKFVGRAKDQRSLKQYQELVKGIYRKGKKLGLQQDLSPSEIAAVSEYSARHYKQINDLLRGSLDLSKVSPLQLDRVKVVAALATAALEKLPPYDEGAFPLFRWETPYGDHLETRYKVNATFEVKEFWSTGAGGGAAIGESSAEILIWGKKGSRARDIATLTNAGSSEGSRGDGHVLKGQGRGEVLFLPGTTFRTVRVDVRDEAGDAVLPNRKAMGTMSYRIEVQEV